jgi:hypothetical protein
LHLHTFTLLSLSPSFEFHDFKRDRGEEKEVRYMTDKAEKKKEKTFKDVFFIDEALRELKLTLSYVQYEYG